MTFRKGYNRRKIGRTQVSRCLIDLEAGSSASGQSEVADAIV